MICNNNKAGAVHSKLCEINYPYVRIGGSQNISPARQRDCTRGSTKPPLSPTLAFEANMHLVSIDEFEALMPPTAKFGNYCTMTWREHFCVDRARKTVNGRRLSWLWVYPYGDVLPANKAAHGLKPDSVWTKAQIVKAYRAVKDPTLPMWTRHGDTFSELAITFCLPRP